MKPTAPGPTPQEKAIAPLSMLINVDVEDLDAGIRFYEQAVGLKLRRRLFEGTVAELDGASSPIYLLQKAEGSSPSADAHQVRTYRRHWTPVHLDFVVAEMEAAVERALSAGAKIEGQVLVFSWGRLAQMSDPFGNGFCFVEWKGRGYDA